jgi:hypothetical protein
VADLVRRRPLAELVDHVAQVVEVLGHKDLADEDQHQSSWLGEANFRNEEDHLDEDMVDVVELACAVHRTEEQVFVAVAACCDACRCLGDHIARPLVEARKALLACHRGQRPRDLHCVLHKLKQRGHRNVPSVVPQASPRRSTWQCAQHLRHRGRPTIAR